MRKVLTSWVGVLGVMSCLILVGCARTEVIESPKTAYAAQTDKPKMPDIIWTSRTLPKGYEYLGRVKTRSWTYEGALSRLIDGARELRADAIVDLHYEQVGFFSTMEAFAIVYK